MDQLKVGLFFAVYLSGCSANPYAIDSYLNVTSYSINYTQHTPKGLGVDGDLDLADIDRRTDEVEACLANLYPDGRIPEKVMRDSSCILSHFDPHIMREYIGVKLASDWHWTPDSCNTAGYGPQQVFACGDAPTPLCEEKGLTISTECPCCWRGAIQDNSTIITTPNLHLFDESLIRVITGCNLIWNSQLATCYSPN